jgi:DNA polymerase-3 subunit gamma/tau
MSKSVEPPLVAEKPRATRPKDVKPKEEQAPPPLQQATAEPVAAQTPAQQPAVEAQAAAPAATPPTEASDIESKLDELQRNWKSVIEGAPQSARRTAALAILRSAGVTPIGINNGVVVLAFKYTYHKEKIDEPENKRVTAEILGNFLGRPCQVECVFEPEDNHLVREAQRRGAQIIKVEEK